MPIQGGFGPGRPILSPTLFGVTALTAGRNDAVTDLYADVDATPSFDLTLSTLKPPPVGKGRKVIGGGAIPGKVPTEDARFALNVLDHPGGRSSTSTPGPRWGRTSAPPRSSR